ncbi:MAG: Maf family protein [Nitrospiraceae bacterium]
MSAGPVVVLASTSPRRRDLLTLLQIPFEIVSPDFDETTVAGCAPSAQAIACAEGKARAVALASATSGRRHEAADVVVIGSDTLIDLDGLVLGKPDSIAHAREMLAQLRGRAHRIRTAVSVCRVGREATPTPIPTMSTRLVTVEVWMKAWSTADVDAYLATGESLGKAGAYAIQGAGASLIDRIDGDFTAAVGLPVRETAELLRDAGLSLPLDVDELYRRRPFENWSRFSGSSYTNRQDARSDGAPRNSAAPRRSPR